MLRNKKILILVMIIIILLLLPNIVKSAENDVVATKIVENTDGSIDFKLTNVNLIEDHQYTWGASKTTSVNDVEKWYTLSTFDVTKKTAVVNFSAGDSKIKNLLKTTDNAWLFIKDNNDNYIVEGLKVDLKLPLLKAFYLTEDKSTTTFESFKIFPNQIYGIRNCYYKFEKITNESIISAYKNAIANNLDLSTISSLATLSDAPETGWKAIEGNYGGLGQYINPKPTEQGLYYIWIKAVDADSKQVIGYNLFYADAQGPEVKSIEVTSPASGTYKTSQTVKIRVCFDENITGTSVPTLKIKFGDSAERSVTNGTIKNNYIEYSYNIQDSDKGQLATVSLNGGTIKDAVGNEAKLSCPIISGNTIKANTEGTTTNNTNNQDTTNTTKPNGTTNNEQDTKTYVTFPLMLINGKGNLKVKNYDGDYKMYYQFVEINDTQYNNVEDLIKKLEKAEISYAEYLNQYKKVLPSYNDSNWIETTDGEFERDLSKYTGTKKFTLWTKLVMKDKTVYEAEIYQMNGTGSTTENPTQTTTQPSTQNPTQTTTKPTTTTTTTTEKDNTVAQTKIPQTGENIIIYVVCALIVGSGAFAYIKFNKYKDI